MDKYKEDLIKKFLLGLADFSIWHLDKEYLQEKIKKVVKENFNGSIRCDECGTWVPDSDINWCPDCGDYYCSDSACGLDGGGTCIGCLECPK